MPMMSNPYVTSANPYQGLPVYNPASQVIQAAIDPTGTEEMSILVQDSDTIEARLANNENASLLVSPSEPAPTTAIQPEPLASQSQVRQRWLLGGERFRRLGYRLRTRRGADDGLGVERVMFAPMILDTATSTPNVGIRTRLDQGLKRPDRLEYYWAKSGRGPAPESNLNVIDNVLRSEIGNEHAVMLSEITMRSLNPDRNPTPLGWVI